MQQAVIGTDPKKKNNKRDLINSINSTLGVPQSPKESPKTSSLAQSIIQQNQSKISELKDNDSFIDNFKQGFEIGGKGLIGNAVYGLGQLADWAEDKKGGTQLKKWADDYIATAPKSDDSTGQFIGSIAPSVIPTVAAITAAPFTGGTSLSAIPAIVGTAPLTLSSFGSGIREYEKYKQGKGEEVDELQKAFVGIAYGTIEFASERIGLGKLLPKGAGSFLLKGNAELAEKAGRNILAQFAQQSPKKAAQLLKKMASAGNIEGLEEVFAEFGQEMVDKTFKSKEDQATLEEFSKNAVKAYAGGLIMGSAIGPISFASQNASNKQRRKKQGFVLIGKDTKTDEAVEIISKDGENYQILSQSGNIRKVPQEQISEIVDVTNEQFNSLLKGKRDFEEQDSEAQMNQARAEIDQERQYTDYLVQNYAKDLEGVSVVEMGNYQGREVIVGKNESTSPGMVYIIDEQSGQPELVSKSEINDIEQIPSEELYQGHEQDLSMVEQQLGNPVQIGEEIEIEGQNAKIAGFNKETGEVNLAIGEGDSVEYQTVDLGLINEFRKPQEPSIEAEESTTNPTDQYFDEEGNIQRPTEIREVEEPVNTKDITVGDTTYQISDGKERLELQQSGLTQKEANDIAKKINERYPKANFIVEDRTGDDIFSDPDFRVVMVKNQGNEKTKDNPKTVESGDSKRVQPEAKPKTPVKDEAKESKKKNEGSDTKQSRGGKSTQPAADNDAKQRSPSISEVSDGGNNDKQRKTPVVKRRRGKGNDKSLPKPKNDMGVLQSVSKQSNVSSDKASPAQKRTRKTDSPTKQKPKERSVQVSFVFADGITRKGEIISEEKGKVRIKTSDGTIYPVSKDAINKGSDVKRSIVESLGYDVPYEQVTSMVASPFTTKRYGDVKSLLGNITKGWENAPQTVVYESYLDFIAAYPQVGLVDQSVAGAWHDGKIHIIASHPQNKTFKGVQTTLLHEAVGHYGLRGVIDQLAQKEQKSFTDKYNQLMDEVVQSKSNDFGRLPQAYYGKELDQLTQEEKRVVAEEYIAHKAQEGSRASVVDKVVSYLRDLFRKWTGKYIDLSDAEIKSIIGNAIRFVKKGSNNYTANQNKEPRFSKPITSNKNFMNWFGKSKVVDSKGKPLVVYHGMPDSREFNKNQVFDKREVTEVIIDENLEKEIRTQLIEEKKSPEHPTSRYFEILDQVPKNKRQETNWAPAFFTENKFIAGTYADDKRAFDYQGAEPEIKQVYLKIENPMIINSYGKGWGQRGSYKKQSEEIAEARKKGHDGIIIKNTKDAYQDNSNIVHDVYITFNSPSQIKSATDNLGNFDPNNNDIRFSKPHIEESAFRYRQRFDGTVRRIQDMFIDLKRLQEGKIKEGAFFNDSMDAYTKENLSSGKINVQQQQFHESHMVPLVEHIKDIGKSGAKLDEVQMYLKSKHAIERNAELLKKQPDKGPSQSGMTDEKAQGVVSDFESKVPKDKVKKLNELIKSINYFILERNLESGLISASQFEQNLKQYEFYVPLRGFAEADYDPTVFSGLGFSAKGRASESGDPLPYLMAMAQDAIVKGEQNKTKQALFEFVKANPDQELYEIKNMWYVKTAEKDAEGNAVWAQTLETPTKEQKESGEAKLKLDYTKESPSSTKFNEDTMTVMVDGQRVSILFKNSNIASAFKKSNVDKMPQVLSYLSGYTRLLGSLYTQYSPEFSLRNFIRDLTTGVINLRTDLGTANAAKIFASVPSAWNTVRKGVFGNNYEGKDGQLYKEFIENGGLTGYSDLKDVTKFQNDLVNEIENIRGGNIKNYTLGMLQKLLKPLDQINRVFENTVRFASYKHLRENGSTEQQSALYAKDITVNFNRKGESSTWLGSFYMFFNASVQGSERLIRPFTSDDKKIKSRAIQAAVALPVMGMVLSMLNRIMGGEDEDGEYFYDKINDHTRHHNIIIPNLVSDKEGDFIKIPLPYGFNTLYAFGDNVTRVMMGKEKPVKAALGTVALTSGSFNPLGAPDLTTGDTEFISSLFRMAMPTAGEPFFDYFVNRNFAGYPIYPEGYPGATPKPDSENYFKSVNPMFRETSKFLNDITGGDKQVPGFVDISPETTEHIFGTVTGGLGSFLLNSTDVALKIGEGQNPFSDKNIKKVPFVRSYVSNPAEGFDRSKYFENKKKIQSAETIYKRYLKSGDRKRALEYRKENIELFRMSGQVDSFERQIDNIKDKISALEKNKNSKAQIKKLEKMQIDLYKKFNKSVNDKKKSVKLSELF